MKVDGASGQQIADALGVELRTVYLWFSDPLVKREQARRLEAVNDRFAELEAAAAVSSAAARDPTGDQPAEPNASAGAAEVESG